jgi:hypothetical protein
VVDRNDRIYAILGAVVLLSRPERATAPETRQQTYRLTRAAHAVSRHDKGILVMLHRGGVCRFLHPSAKCKDSDIWVGSKAQSGLSCLQEGADEAPVHVGV